MAGGKKSTTNQTQTATTQLPQWLTDAGQANYGRAQAYIDSPGAQWSPETAARYANPYQQQVQDRTVARMGQQDQVEHQQLNDAAEGAKAYGGTRHAVLEGAQSRDQNANMLDYLAQSNAQGYDTARSNFNADRASTMGGYSMLSQMLQGAPRNTTTTGTSSGTTKEQGSWIDTVLGAAQVAASLYSDRRLKTDISLIGRLDSDIRVYRFRYLWDRATDALRTGVMADEVARIAPHALGPVRGGYLTVDYTKLVGGMA